MIAAKRRFVTVNGRRVHYRRAGKGPPLVMLHGSPADSEMLASEMAAASEHFTCFALDTPGFGSSDPLPGDTLSVRDLAEATADAISALGLPPCLIYGTHTGAAIAIELGVGWPERATGLILDGLPIFTDAEIAVLFKGYFAPVLIDPLGGHFTSTWIRFRDQFIWFPWISRDVTRLNPVDRPTPAEIDHWVAMFYRSCKTYGPAYRAACFYGQGALRAAESLVVPTVYAASAEDMLFPHLDRLPPLKAEQRIERLPYDPLAKLDAIVGFARSLPAGAPVESERFDPPVGVDPAMQFIDTTDGQVFVRCYGDPDKPAIVLLHDAPGTGLAFQELARSVADGAWVIVPDLPGCGESDAPGEDPPVLDASAQAIGAIASALGLKQFTIAATGCGCAVAAAFALLRDPRLERVLLQDVPAPDEAVAACIAPEIKLSPYGAHWIQAWLMVRDGQIYKPWFDGRIAAQRRTQGNFDAEWLHDQTIALMKSRTSYHRLPREAYRFDSAAALSSAEVAVGIAESDSLAALVRATLGA
jgi:pimeloyl-ACP methyl ester carboxylesterase